MAQVGMLVTTGARTTGIMRLDEIVTEICKRVNDPFEDNYAERARELFVASVYQGYKDPKYTKFDYHGLVGTRNFSTGRENKMQPLRLTVVSISFHIFVHITL